jgi:class 3 adenylate cyclase/predicted ATPase
MEVGDWLRKLGLERYEPAFRENKISGEILPKLTAEDLKDLGVVLVGDRRVLLEAIGSLRAEAKAPATKLPDIDDRASGGGLIRAETERRQLTVMFCDLVGSTALCGKLDPEDYREVIKSFQKAVSEAVRRFDGYVAKYLGDGILVYFGYPQAHEDDAERAIRSGLAALDRVRRLRSHPDVSLDARIGIATGLVVAGDIAEEGVSETGAISGETPNLAARLQGLASPGEVVISQSTHKLAAEIFDCEDLGIQNLKGITPPTNAWRIRGERQAESRFDAQHGAGLTEFVGRSDEVELLLRRWERSKSGEGQVVLISGEPGIGKSRLTQYLRGCVASDPHMALRYQCSPHHTISAFYPVISQLAFAAGIAADERSASKLDKLEALLSKAASDVQSIAPLFADLLSIPYAGRYPALDLTPQQQKVRTLKALKDQLRGLADRQPVILVFEDLHWSDPTTQELLDLTVDQTRDASILALMTFRPEYQPRWVGQSHVTFIALNRLDRRQCAELARNVAAQAALPVGAIDEIVQRTEGVPLFVEELTRALLEGGMSESVPSTIQASLLARLDRLGVAKQVAQIGAVIGRKFDHSLLAAVSPIARQELDDALGRLVDSELVFRRGSPPDAIYTFKHALVQDVAYESLLKSRRRKIHADIAGALRNQFPMLEANEPELLAHHYSQAGLADLAIGYWEKAGNRALERSANVEAVGHFRAALVLLDALPPEVRSAKELTLQIGLGSALTSVEGYSAPASGAAYQRGRELCLELGDRKRLFPVMYGLWNYDVAAGRHEQGRRTASKFMKLAEEEGQPGPLLFAHSALGVTLTFMGFWSDAHESLGKCIAFYDLPRDALLKLEYAEDPCVQALVMNSICVWNLGYPERAIESMNQAVRLAEQLQHANSTGYALTFVPMLHGWLGDPKAALLASEASIAFCRERDLAMWVSFARPSRGWALARLGQIDVGLAEISAGIKLYRETGGSAFTTGLQALLADACRMAARYDDALSAIEEGLRFAVDLSEGFRKAELLRLKGLVLLDQAPTDFEPAEKWLLNALEVARQQKARSMELRIAIDLAKLWRAQGKTSKAVDLLGPVYASFTEGFGTQDLKEAKALLAKLNA